MECRTVRKIWLAAALVLALVLGCGLAQADVVVEVDTHAELLQAIADAKAAGEQAIADGKEAPLYVIRLTTETLVLDQLIVEPLGGTLNYYHFLVLEYPARVSIESACQSGTTITVDWDEYSSLIAAGKGFGAPILINGSYYQENGSYYTTVDPLLRLRNLTFDFSGSSKMKSHELMINGMGGTLDLENVTFRNLERNGGYDRQLLIVSGMEIKMSNCIFEDNALLSRTGKSTAFAASASNVRVENCTFRDNTGNYGAAVQIDGVGFLGHKNPEALFINCAFTGNTSWSSPAFRSEYAEVTLQSCTFTGNKAVSDEDLHREGGGAIAIAHSTVALQDCTFEDNMTDFSGGAIQIMYKSDVTVDGCTITGNSADTHGGAFCLTDYFRDDPSEGSVLKIVNTTISSNVSTGKHGDITHRGDNYSPGGGAIYMHPNCKLILGEGTILADNTVEVYDKTADSYHGGAIYAAYGSEIVIDGAVITGNKARHGGAVYLEGAGTLEGIQGEHDPGAFPKSKGNGAVMTLKNGLIAENHAAKNGGAVYVGGQTMVDGAEYQGAVFTMTGGVVTDNQADDMGGGVYVQGAKMPHGDNDTFSRPRDD